MSLEENERPNPSILKFESMLKTDDVYFFDAEDFEEIIHYYLDHGKISLAKKGIKLGLEQHPHSMELKLLDVEVLIFENKLDRAEKMLDSLQLLDAFNDEIFIQRASIYSKKDNHEAAIAMLEKAMEMTDDSFDIHSLLGMEYLFLDNYGMAKENFMRCVALDEEDYASLYNVVYCFEYLEDYEGAIQYLNDYLEHHPYCEVAWHQLGKMYQSQKMLREALTAFDFAIISDEDFMGAYFEKGQVLEKLGQYEEAIENYETTLAIDDPTSHAYLRIGKCHEKLGNDDLAKKYFYKTVHEDPLLDKGWLAITEYYHKRKDYEKALYYINKAINIDGENPLYWKKSANIYMALQNYDEADFSFKQTVELGNYELDTWISWSNLLLGNHDITSALQILAQGAEFYPESAELQYKMAGLHLLNNQLEEGQECFSQALKLDRDKLSQFNEEFPQFLDSKMLSTILEKAKKASK